MPRRELLLTLGTAAVTLTGLTTTNAADHATHGGGPADHCARACANSLIECAKHVNHCTQHLADGHKAYAKCLELCSACASSCSACIQSCFGPAGATTAEACAKMCDLCAAECEKFDDDAMNAVREDVPRLRQSLPGVCENLLTPHLPHHEKTSPSPRSRRARSAATWRSAHRALSCRMPSRICAQRKAPQSSTECGATATRALPKSTIAASGPT